MKKAAETIMFRIVCQALHVLGSPSRPASPRRGQLGAVTARLGEKCEG